MKITILGIDIAKTVFVLVGLDEKGHEVLKKKLSRTQLKQMLMNLPPCKVAMEACGSSHYWGRQIEAMGHRVVLIPPQYVKPFVRTNKNDTNDARAICEAALRPSTPTVPVKTEDAQDIQSLHRATGSRQSQDSRKAPTRERLGKKTHEENFLTDCLLPNGQWRANRKNDSAKRCRSSSRRVWRKTLGETTFRVRGRESGRSEKTCWKRNRGPGQWTSGRRLSAD